MAKGRAVAIALDVSERLALTALTRKHGAPQAIAERARLVLAAASGLRNKEIASKLGVCAHTVGRWRNRFSPSKLKRNRPSLPVLAWESHPYLGLDLAK
jgi:FixJ family two-component response regulator